MNQSLWNRNLSQNISTKGNVLSNRYLCVLEGKIKYLHAENTNKNCNALNMHFGTINWLSSLQ